MGSVLRALGIKVPPKSVRARGGAAAVLGDPDRVRSMVDAGPPEAALVLRKMAQTGAR